MLLFQTFLFATLAAGLTQDGEQQDGAAEGGTASVEAAELDVAQADRAEAHTQLDHVSCNQSAYEVRLTVDDVKESIGLMTAELYRNDNKNFLQSEGRISKTRFAAIAPQTTFCIEVPEPGQYAIVVYHDENANLRVDKGAFGIPTEPWAISNDPPIRFGPPSVEDSLITVGDGGADVHVALNDR